MPKEPKQNNKKTSGEPSNKTKKQEEEQSFTLVRSKGGRPPGSVLDKVLVQRSMLEHIVITGDVETCYSEYCTRNTYVAWVKRNRDHWEDLVSKALKQHKNRGVFTHPDVRGLVMKKMLKRIQDDKATLSEMQRFLEMLPETPL